MTARLTDKELPSAEKLRDNFASKGTPITDREAEILLREVRVHRNIEDGESKFTDPEDKEKPAAKAELQDVISRVGKLEEEARQRSVYGSVEEEKKPAPVKTDRSYGR